MCRCHGYPIFPISDFFPRGFHKTKSFIFMPVILCPAGHPLNSGNVLIYFIIPACYARIIMMEKGHTFRFPALTGSHR